MALYIEIAPDGTREEVKYNPHHDGPVSHRITLEKRIAWLNRQLAFRSVGNSAIRKRLKEAHRQLRIFQQKVSSSKSHQIQNLARRHEQGHSSQDQAHRDERHKSLAWHRNRSASDSAIGLGLPANTPGQPSIPPLDVLFGHQYPLEPISTGLA